MKNIRRICLALIAILVGTTFIYTGWTKLDPIQNFEYTIVEFTGLPWTVSAIIARLLIGVEVALGVMIAAHLWGGKKIPLRAALLLLVIFSVYLLYLWATVGDDVNCGCFGDKLTMTASQSLIKNLVLIGFILLLMRFHRGLTFYWQRFVNPVIVIVIIALPFILFAIPDNQWTIKQKFYLNLSPLFNPRAARPPAPAGLSEGKHVISFLSLSCAHCRMAAHKMHIMKQRNPSLPFYFVIAGKDKYLESFWTETKAIDIPHTRLDADSFTNMVGFAWPVIYGVNNSYVEAESNYIQLDQSVIEKWLRSDKAE